MLNPQLNHKNVFYHYKYFLQENGRSVPDLTASPGRAPTTPAPMPTNQNAALNQKQNNVKEPVLLQGDFRKVSGISSEIFRQIEAVENDHDPSTAAALEVYITHILLYNKKSNTQSLNKINRQLNVVVK